MAQAARTSKHRPATRWGLAAALAAPGGFAAAWYLADGPWWLASVASAVPWFVWIRARASADLAAAAAVVGGLFLFHIADAVGYYSGLGVQVACGLCWGAAAAGGAWLASRANPRTPWRLGSRWPVYVAAGIGPAVWLTCISIGALFAPDAGSWTMTGDAGANLIYGRGLVADGGAPLPPQSLRYVLTRGVLAAGIAPSADGDAIHRFDAQIGVLTATWAVGAAAAIALAALAAARIASTLGASGRGAALVAGSVSVGMLGWYGLGYPVAYGFLNAPLTLSLLFGALLAFLGRGDHPVIAAAVLLMSGRLLFGLWLPLAAIPGVLLVATLWPMRKRFGRLSRWAKWSLGAILLGGLGFVAFALGPALLDKSELTSEAGSAIDIHRALFLSLLALVALAAVYLISPVRPGLATTMLALVAVTMVERISLVVLSGQFATVSYYPQKFAWFVTVFFLVVVAGTVPAAFRKVASATRVIQVTSAALVAAVVVLAAPGLVHEVQRSAIPEALGLRAKRPELRGMVEPLVDDTVLRLRWSTGAENEYYANLWAAQLGMSPYDWAKGGLRAPVVVSAFDETGDIDQLCEIALYALRPVEVTTADPHLPADVAFNCSWWRIEVEVVTP